MSIQISWIYSDCHLDINWKFTGTMFGIPCIGMPRFSHQHIWLNWSDLLFWSSSSFMKMPSHALLLLFRERATAQISVHYGICRGTVGGIPPCYGLIVYSDMPTVWKCLLSIYLWYLWRIKLRRITIYNYLFFLFLRQCYQYIIDFCFTSCDLLGLYLTENLMIFMHFYFTSNICFEFILDIDLVGDWDTVH